MKQILALIRQNPFFSAVSVIGTAVSITFVMVIYMVYDIPVLELLRSDLR
jgi:putative ABC transport system permease protein